MLHFWKFDIFLERGIEANDQPALGASENVRVFQAVSMIIVGKEFKIFMPQDVG